MATIMAWTFAITSFVVVYCIGALLWKRLKCIESKIDDLSKSMDGIKNHDAKFESIQREIKSVETVTKIPVEDQNETNMPRADDDLIPDGFLNKNREDF